MIWKRFFLYHCSNLFLFIINSFFGVIIEPILVVHCFIVPIAEQLYKLTTCIATNETHKAESNTD